VAATLVVRVDTHFTGASIVNVASVHDAGTPPVTSSATETTPVVIPPPLPPTGDDPRPLLQTALELVLAGAALVLMGRRRRIHLK
jgi:hypothetical protein